MLEGIEEEDYEVIKNLLCLPNTELNTTGKNPYSVSRLSLIPEAKLWNTVNTPMFDTDKYQAEKTGWTRAFYMRMMNMADAEPLNISIPTPPASPVYEADARVEDSAPPTPAEPSATIEQNRTPPPSPPIIPGQNTRNSPRIHTSSSAPSPSAPAQSEEAGSLQYMLLRSQLQRIEARQLHFQNEVKEGDTEEVHFSSDDENDVFDWQSPRDHLLALGPSTSTPAPAAPILSSAPTPTTAEQLKGQLKIHLQGNEARPLLGELLTKAVHPAQMRRRQISALPSAEEDIMSSLLRVMKMTGTLKFQCQNRYNLPILLSPHLFKFLPTLLILCFLPCVEDNASLEFGGAFVCIYLFLLIYFVMHESKSSCKEAVLGLHHLRQKNQLHFKECMIQRLCENSMQKPARKRFSQRLKDHVFRDTHTQNPCDVFL
ncbi:hypothetical protein GQ457_13G014270 [Hibiscus cannabinus]